MLNTIWKWFFRFVVGVGLLYVALMLLLVFGMTRPNVEESDGYVDSTAQAIPYTISHTLPDSATQIRFLSASVGMGGRLRLYRFAAPIDDLNAHAVSEFDAHWDRPGYKATPNAVSPFDEHDVKRNSEFYRGNADWMLPPPNAVGTLYEPADGNWPHRPMIFVDETNGVLYFQMTD
mgnify:CR=1 FL=1|tara:strand:- start:471 stop:998 length:528 start_codon:yes stop_codon:yes gene_type:complete